LPGLIWGEMNVNRAIAQGRDWTEYGPAGIHPA
jgi:hypothetical protein